MSNRNKLLDAIRRASSDAENDLIDELPAGISAGGSSCATARSSACRRRCCWRRPAEFGSGPAPRRTRGDGGDLRVAQTTPSGAIDPVTVPDSGGVIMLCQTGEYLAISAGDLRLRPVLAESWKPNQDGSVWTFKLRQGVKFHNGKTMSADDVVATIDRLADPKNASNALSAFSGVLSKGGTKKVDDDTVEFHLDAPNGNFPYYVSSDNYNTIILPADYAGDFEKNFIGTGPFKLEKYTPKAGASFLRNPDYWGPKALPERTEFSFYADIQPQIVALQGRVVDVVAQVPVLQGMALLNDPKVNHQPAIERPYPGAYAHRHGALHRQAGAPRDRALPGSPEAGQRPVPRPVRHRQRQPLRTRLSLDRYRGAAARPGHRPGQAIDGRRGIRRRIQGQADHREVHRDPGLRQIIQQAVRPIGVTIDLNVESQDAYYGKAVFGQSDWLDSVMGATDYGHRGVPNVLLAAPLTSDGTWNSAHFKNKEYDRLVSQYVAALDLGSQRAAAGKIQTLLLDETPVIFSYFYNFLPATAKGATGVETTAMAHVFLANASPG